MKKIFLFLAVAAMISACGGNDKPADEQTADQETTISAENLVELTLGVEGMTCEGCENAVKKNIGSLEGIAEVSASHTDCNTVVKYDATKTSPEDIKAKIAEAGYTVKADV